MRLVLPLIAAMAVVALGGCGSDSAPVSSSAAAGDPATASTASSGLTPPGSPGSVAAGTGSTVPLGISPSQLERRLGAPAVAMRPYKGGVDCTLYLIAEQPPFVKLRYCFRDEHLKFLATYAVEASP